MSLRNSLITGLFIFLLLGITVGLVNTHFGVEFGQRNFFEVRGIFFLIFITLFPRLTLLFSSVPFGGIFWWLGFFFCPRILVATLATIAYFYTNPVLVVFSWMIALSGELAEKWSLGRRGVFIRVGGNGFTYKHQQQQAAPKHSRVNEGVVEAEFKRMD